jgi:energy-coupling factor transporter ATP-binding protein EcfA2
MASPEAQDTQLFEKHRFLGRLKLRAGTPPAQFILYGRVGDFYYFPHQTPYHDAQFLSMRQTLITYLLELQYQIIAIFNMSEGLFFARPEMEQRYLQTTRKHGKTQSYIEDAPFGRTAGGAGTAARPEVAPKPGKPEHSAAAASAATRPQQAGEQIAGLGNLLRQNAVKSAVIIERVHNVVTNSSALEDRQIIDQIQSWASLINNNVSFLLADVETLGDLPAALAGRQRSGVVLIDVGLPTQEEIDQVLTSAETGLISSDFDPHQKPAPSLGINPMQRADLAGRLEPYDLLTIRSYFNECVRRGYQELTLRRLMMVTTQTTDVWPTCLNTEKIQLVHDTLHDRIRGQAHVIDDLIRSFENIRFRVEYQAKTGQSDEKLLGYYFFAGPTGVGKTEIFRILAQIFHPVIRTRKFNMPEYREEHSVSRFFGAPPGYIGYGRGELGAFLLQQPATIVLFDEFEKANERIWENFLTMLEGGLTTGDGIRVDLSQAIFIFTSNAGAEELQQLPVDMDKTEWEKQSKDIVQQALRDRKAPQELIGRLLNAIIPFRSLATADVREIIRYRLRQLEERHQVRCDGSVERFLLDWYTEHRKYGARAVVNYIEDTLQAEVVSQRRHDMEIIYIDEHMQTHHTDVIEASVPTYQSGDFLKQRTERDE